MKRAVLFFLLLFTICTSAVSAQNASANSRYSVQMDIHKAYISGVCIMHEEEERITASIMNEFGVSALTYQYNKQSGKVKILSILKKMDKWYIKRVLKKDLKMVMKEMPLKEPLTYKNQKYKIIYQFTPLQDEAAE